MRNRNWTRREAILGVATIEAGSRLFARTDAPYNAMGERVGEVTSTSAIVHTRLTASPVRNNGGYQVKMREKNKAWLTQEGPPPGMPVSAFEGACPGAAGRVRLHYGMDAKLARASATAWVTVHSSRDYAHQFELKGLQPQTTYYYATETAALGGDSRRRGEIGSFVTAPPPDRRVAVSGFVITCQQYNCRDHPGGFHSYESMLRLGGNFMACTGDNVYYDTEPPVARSLDLARFHWQRMYSQPTVVNCLHAMSGYWMKDDHDTFQDDCWTTRQGDRVAPMTYQTLAPIFREQTPYGRGPYRKMRWGRGVELWFLEGRDFRSPNSDPDGPNKTLWGKKQKDWLKRTLLESDADFRVLVSPGCIVGPGGHEARSVFKMPSGGADSHGDGGYATERNEFLGWLRDHKVHNAVIVGGDRHWQHHSVDPISGVHEFGCGPLSDSHATNSAPTSDLQRFVRAAGGFISLAYEPGDRRLSVRLHDVHGKHVHEQSYGT